MKNYLGISDPFEMLAKYERFTQCCSLHELQHDAEATSFMENQKKLHEIKMILFMTNRLFLLSSAVFGFCSLPIVYHFVLGWSVPLMKFLTISRIIFPVYFFLVYDRLAVNPKNVRLREFLKQYRSILVRVISAQRALVSL